MPRKALPEVVSIDVASLTSNQQIELEELLNADFGRVMKSLGSGEQFINDDGKRVRGGEVNRALIYVALKGEYPDLTIEEAGDVPLSSLKQDDSESSEPEPDATA